MIATGCVILFFLAGQPLPAMVTIKDAGTCQALLLTTALVSDPEAEKKLEPLKPLLQPDEPAQEKK